MDPHRERRRHSQVPPLFAPLYAQEIVHRYTNCLDLCSNCIPSPHMAALVGTLLAPFCAVLSTHSAMGTLALRSDAIASLSYPILRSKSMLCSESYLVVFLEQPNTNVGGPTTISACSLLSSSLHALFPSVPSHAGITGGAIYPVLFTIIIFQLKFNFN